MDRRPRLSEAFSGIGLYQSGGYAQQGRFAGAVAPDEADPVAGRDGQARAGQERRRPEGQADVCSESNGVGTLQPLALSLAPHGREPGLPLSRQAGRAVVMVQFDETGRSHVVAPGVEVEEARVTTVAPAFLVVSARV